MIIYVQDEFFYSPARVLLNPVNTVGAMGGDIAGDFKRFYPDMYAQFQALCQRDALDIGQYFFYHTAHKSILNLPIRKHFRANPRLEYIQAGVQKIASTYADVGITSLAMPALAWDELDWEAEVRPILEGILGALPIMVYIYLPSAGHDKNRNLRLIRNWLHGTPQPIAFDAFTQHLIKLAEKTSHWRTFNTQATFRLKYAPRQQGDYKRHHFKITPSQHPPIFLSDNALRDLWRYVQRVGYVLGDYLPNGLDAHADYILPILAQLPMVQTVTLARQGESDQTGVHYIAPIAKTPPRPIST